MNNETEDTYINEHLIRNSTQSNRYLYLKKTVFSIPKLTMQAKMNIFTGK